MYTAPCNCRQLFYYYLTITELAAQKGYLLFAGRRAANLNGVAEGNLKHTNHLQGLKALPAGPCLLFWSDVLLKLEISLSNSSVTALGVCVWVCVHPGIHLCAHVYVSFNIMPHGLMKSLWNWRRQHLHSLILKCLLKHKIARCWCRLGYWEMAHLVSRQALVLDKALGWLIFQAGLHVRDLVALCLLVILLLKINTYW